MSLLVNEGILTKFQQMKKLFYSNTRVPEENNWKKCSNNDIWLETVAQIVVVGRSDPWEKLKMRADLKNKIAWENLLQIMSQEELRATINHVLLAVGTRYASDDVTKSVKAKALAYNLNVLKGFKDGPRGFLTQLSEFQGPDRDKIRIKCVMNTLMYIKNKGARDLLMELGIVRNAIALDIRIQTILQKVGIQMPEGFQSNSRLYDELEKDILTKICAPLGIAGVAFDRMLYQNYEEILSMQL
jgi:hypothetical protein